MKKLLLYIFIASSFIACKSVDKYDKNDLRGVRKIEEGLYMEIYRIYSGGVYGGDIHSCYLTDSISFRMYLGFYDDHEQINAFPINDSIIFVRKYDRNTNKTLEKTEYNLFTLKHERKFE